MSETTDDVVPQLTASPSPSRRTLLRGAVIAGVTAPILAACGSDDGEPSSADTTGSDPESSAPTNGADPSGGGDGGDGGGGTAIASTDDVPEGGGVILDDEGVVLTQPSAGEFKGFTNICTHQGCPVASVDGGTINCTCHGSQFSIEDGSVVTGPAASPLEEKALVVAGSDISLA